MKSPQNDTLLILLLKVRNHSLECVTVVHKSFNKFEEETLLLLRCVHVDDGGHRRVYAKQMARLFADILFSLSCFEIE